MKLELNIILTFVISLLLIWGLSHVKEWNENIGQDYQYTESAISSAFNYGIVIPDTQDPEIMIGVYREQVKQKVNAIEKKYGKRIQDIHIGDVDPLDHQKIRIKNIAQAIEENPKILINEPRDPKFVRIILTLAQVFLGFGAVIQLFKYIRAKVGI